MQLGLVHIYTGESKGKTTAAMGLACRVAGYGLKVMIVQFFKFQTGEKIFFERTPNVSYRQFRYPASYFKKYDSPQFQEVRDKFFEFWDSFLEDFEAAPPDLLIFDELSYAFSDGLCDADLVCHFLDHKPKNTEVVMTGRDFPDELISRAQYVTNMQMIKHPYRDAKIMARKGVEY